jgi:hypothetical protein
MSLCRLVDLLETLHDREVQYIPSREKLCRRHFLEATYPSLAMHFETISAREPRQFPNMIRLCTNNQGTPPPDYPQYSCRAEHQQHRTKQRRRPSSHYQLVL